MSGIMQLFKGAVFGSARSQFRFGSGLGYPINLSGLISSQVNGSGVGLSDTNEDTLFTFSLPSKSMDSNGRGVFIEAFGSLANNAHTKTVKLYFGTGIVYTAINGTNANAGFDIGLQVMRTASAQQVYFSMGALGGTTLTTNVAVGQEDLTAAVTIKVTGQTATLGASDILAYGMSVQGFN
jgi:hypothetical protein